MGQPFYWARHKALDQYCVEIKDLTAEEFRLKLKKKMKEVLKEEQLGEYFPDGLDSDKLKRQLTKDR